MYLGNSDIEGHRPDSEEQSISPFPEILQAPLLTRTPPQLEPTTQEETFPLEDGPAAFLVSTSTLVATLPQGPVGYCWPGHPEIEDQWVLDRFQDFNELIFTKSELSLKTLENRKTWERHGNGKGYKSHAASAGKQLGTKAVLAYGAIASCIGTTTWRISYRTSGDWKWILNGWECLPGNVGFWRVPAKLRPKKFLGLPNGHEYDRFDIKFSAESEAGAFHRYFVGFWSLPDP